MIQIQEICEECRQSTSGQCFKHTPQVTVTIPQTTFSPSFTLTPFPLVQQGWQCPVCHRVYAPSMAMCTQCPLPVSVYTTTTTTHS